MVAYLLGNGNVVTGGKTVDGVIDGEMSSALYWSYCYEAALIQPPREALDVSMGECASGTR